MNTPQLTPEELKQHQDFIHHCVMNNVYLKSPAKFGRDLNMSIQEIVHSNVTTLRSIGTQVENIIRTSGSSSFAAEGALRINGVDADNWVSFLKLQIRLTKATEEAEDRAEKIKSLRLELEKYKTPGEMRTDIENKIAELEGRPLGTPTVA